MASEEPTESSRARMLARIRRSLEQTQRQLELQAAAYQPPHPRSPTMPSDAELVEQFRAELSALQGHVHICESATAAEALVLDLLRDIEPDETLAWGADLPLPGLVERLRAAGFTVNDGGSAPADRHERLAEQSRARVGITGADAAIAESGTIALVSGEGRARLASLLTPIHLALLPAERIVRTLPEAFDLLRERFGADLLRQRSNLNLITGPSRTGDIELSLTLGVHGPSEIHVIVIS